MLRSPLRPPLSSPLSSPLARRRGKATLGPELVTSTAVVYGGWTESGGVVTAPGTSGAADNVTFALSTPTVAGRFYQVLVPNNMPSNGFYLDFGSGTGSQVGALSAANQSVVLTCTAPGTIIRVGRWAGSVSGTMGPLSVREIL